MRPLDPLGSLKVKLGAVIVGTVAVTVLVIFVSGRVGIPMRLSIVLATLVGLSMVQLLAHGTVAPLREMRAAAQFMAAGHYDHRVSASSNDEVGDLARAFNAMAAELAEVDRIRRDLVANVSHELRTPIAALQAVLENMVDGVEPADPVTLQVMLNQVQRLGRLVSQLLDLSRLESGALPLQRQSFEVAPVLEEVAAAARLHTAIDVVVQAPHGVVAHGDPERVHQVIANLVENAVRFSPSGGAVEVRAHAAASAGAGGGTAVIEVLDEGPGIAASEATRVFERFYRSDGARAAAEGGAGLGLAISKWIIDLHGGRIWPERREPRGCRMVVELPAATHST
jgi:signal transduction histidine kinase